MLASTLFQQSPAQPYYSQTGNWEYITLSDGSRVRWRNQAIIPSTPTDGSGPDARPPITLEESRVEVLDTYGIHAVVLPRKVYFPNPDTSNPQVPLVGLRGAVMLWGNGTQYTTAGSLFTDDYAFSPFLLWHHRFGLAPDRWRLGHIGYSNDRLWWGQLDPDNRKSHYNNSANLFCSSTSLMADGRLFVAGGSQYFRYFEDDVLKTQIHGTLGCYAFDPEPWRFNTTESAQSGWSEPLGPDGRFGIGMNRWRWYPSTLLLPNKKMLIVGGTKHAEDKGKSCSEDDFAFDPPNFTSGHRFAATFQLYDPVANQYSEYPLRKLACVGQQSEQFHHKDQRPTLGYEYPRLHGVSWMHSGQLHYRVAAVGPTYNVYLMDPINLVAGDPSNSDPNADGPFNWKRNGVCHGESPSSDFARTRTAGTSVLLPRMDAMNPQTAAEQCLYEVAVLGGYSRVHVGDQEVCATWMGWDFINVLTFKNAPSPLDSACNVLRRKGPFSPPDGGRVHTYGTILPTGDVLIAGSMNTFQLGCGWSWSNVNGFTYLYRAEAITGRWDAYESAGQTLGGALSSMARMPDAPSDDSDQSFLQSGETCQSLSPTDDRWRIQGQFSTPDGIRAYHSTAVLLPDASVLTAGTDMYRDLTGPTVECTKYVSRTPTIYYPTYFYRPGANEKRLPEERPQVVDIAKEETWGYGEEMKIDFAKAGGMFSAPIKSVALIRPSTATHSVNFDQRLVRCSFYLDTPTTLNVTTPFAPEIAPPGWYMLFLIDENDIPSEAAWIRLDYSDQIILEGELEEMGEGDSDQGQMSWPRLEFEIRDSAANHLVSKHSIPMSGLDEQGRFSTKLYSILAPGEYRVRVTPYLNWLGKETIVTVGQDLRLSIGGLANGDANGDNLVDTEDMFQIAAAAGQLGHGDLRDLNKDGWIDAADLAIALWNLGRQGD